MSGSSVCELIANGVIVTEENNKKKKTNTPSSRGKTKRKNSNNARGKCVLYVNHTACIVFCDYCYYYIAPLFRLSIADAAVLFRAVRLIVHIFIKSFQPPKITNDGHLHYTVLLSQPMFVYTQSRVKLYIYIRATRVEKPAAAHALSYDEIRRGFTRVDYIIRANVYKTCLHHTLHKNVYAY